LLAAVATGSVAMPEKEPFPSAGTAEQPAPNGLAIMSSDEDDEEELELLELGIEDDEDEAAVSEPEFPQAARESGRARLRAAMVLRRASRMMWLLAW